MNEIHFTVNGRNLKAEENSILTTGSLNSDKCVFTFDSQWNGFSKKIVFLTVDNEEFSEYIDNDGSFIIPEEALRSAGLLKVGVVGSDSAGTVISTNFAALKVITGANETESMPLVLEDSLKNHEGGAVQ